MTIATTQSSVTYAGNGISTVFAYSFLIPQAGEEVVIYTDALGNSSQLASSLYTITGAGSPSGGTIIYPLTGSPIASGTTLTISRSLPLTQATSFSNQGAYLPTATEAAFDYAMMVAQQLNNATSRSLQAPLADNLELNNLPIATKRANQLLGFDASGQPIAAQPSSALVSTVMQNVVSAATLVAALLQMQAWSVGDFKPTASATVPTGWLLCNGQAVSRTAYSLLFAAIGTAWGTGDGSTTFNVPDFRGYALAGADNMGGSAANRLPGYSLATRGGSASHTLVASELPVVAYQDFGHGHAVIDPGHSHSILNQNSGSAGGAAVVLSTTVTTGAVPISTQSATTGIAINTGNANINNPGGGNAHSIVQPTAAVNILIFAGYPS